MKPGTELRKLAHSLGWVVVRQSGKHSIYESKSGYRMPLPSTPSDSRTIANIRSKLKRYA